jgi:hypothetical protein
MTMTDREGGAKSVLDEIVSVKKNLPDIEIQTETSHFCTVIYAKLPHRRIKLTLTFPETYPSRALIVDVAAERGIPPGLKKKIEKELGEVAAANEGGRYRQIEPVLARLKFFVDTNKFVSCWKELRQVVDCIQKLRQTDDYKKSAISINDAKGLVHLKLWNGEYYYSCSLTINDAYPTTISNHDWGKACFLVKGKTNLPSKIEHMLTTQAQELARRMQDGMSADDALLMSNPVKAPRGMEFCGAAKITATAAKETKGAKGGRCKGHAENTPKCELPEWQAEEQSRMVGYHIASYDGSGPQPSLLALVTFLVNKIQRLPDMNCPICKAPSLPKDPKILSSFYEPVASVATDVEKRAHKVAQLNRPTRTYCGCWYHYKCLHTFLTQPPFGAACPVDERRVFHPDWPEDMQELERAWAMKQAKEREIEDAAMAFM